MNDQTPDPAVPPTTFWRLRYRRPADVVLREIGEERILIPIKGQLADLRCVYTLNPVAAAIWGKIDGFRSMAAIREVLLAEYQADRAVLEADLAELIGQLAAAGLVEVVP